MKTAAKGLWLLAAAFLLSVFKYFRRLNLFQICCKKAVYYKILVRVSKVMIKALKYSKI